MIKLFVVGYPLDIQESELIELFSFHGMINSLDLVTDKFTKKHKGFGFVEMVDQAGADRAIRALNGLVLRGRKISVKLAEENRPERSRPTRINHFADNDQQNNIKQDTFKNKRPRKLVNNTFRAE
ncbi:RNA binding protein [Pedobacter sp. BAL39]|uniref:RNA recognition motif domain-containing protein n=1 Tax=Pedobacter sp. BAL39 TaxID=391596 RepID=UPI00015594D0|nr:RNA-binding protein [Pedobacter sp. BAL39]EDM37672.1 RNA binding protein [Pedobacter sp. BAL39]